MSRLQRSRACALALAVTVFAIGPRAVASAPQAPDVTVFAAKSKFLTAKISPRGDYVAVQTWIDDTIGVAILNVESKRMTGAMKLPHPNQVHDFWWVSDNRVVAEVARSLGTLDQPRLTGELLGMDADGSHQSYLHGFQGNEAVGTHLRKVFKERSWGFMVDPLPDQPDAALIVVTPWDATQTQKLYLLDVNTGAVKYRGGVTGARVGGEGADYGIDAQGNPRYAVVQGENGRIRELRRGEGLEWETVVDHGADGATVGVLGVDGQGANVYLLSDEGGDRVCVMVREIQSGAVRGRACHPGVDAGLPALSASGGRPLVMNYENGRPETVFFDTRGEEVGAFKALQAAFPGQRIRVTSATRDGQKMLVLVDSDVDPGDFYLFDLKARKAAFLMALNDRVDPRVMAPVTPVDFEASDGLQLHGYLTRPRQHPEGPLPLVVVPHGGPHGVRDTWSWDAWPQYLASLGYAVLQVNYRGSDGYGRAFRSAGYRRWGTRMQDDLADAVKWAIKSGIADANRVGIMGASYGGYAALMSAIRSPGLFRCAVSYAGVTDLVTHREDTDATDTRLGRSYFNRVVGTDDEALREQSPVTHVADLQVPVLIAHGTQDRRVPFDQALEMRDALDRLHKPYVWLPFQGEEHGFYVDANHQKFLLAVRDFLARHLGTPSDAPTQSGRADND